MSLQPTRPMTLDLVFQYALACAAQEDDPRDRELGPIHLLKYAYLGDLAFAAVNGGQTFTLVPWRFHHYGPWNVDAWQRIPVAMGAVEAAERHFSSRFQEDHVRWRLEDQRDPDQVVPGLPTEVARAVRRAVHTFRGDTYGLLRHVYLTTPMLHAAPGEILDLRATAEARLEDKPEAGAPPASPQMLPMLSKTAAKRLKERLSAKLKERRQSKALVDPDPPPRYDETFFEGIAWLDTLAGDPIEETSGVLRFSDSVWRSEARRDPEVS